MLKIFFNIYNNSSSEAWKIIKIRKKMCLKTWPKSNSIVKEIIAFCNTNGGTIILGYDDNGKVVGWNNAKADLDRLSSKINDSIEPSANFLISTRIEIEEDKEIIVVEVLRGTNKPYYIKAKGMTIDGVFVRLGATVQHATRETIKEMILESSGISFEKNISINQDLTFSYANRLFKKKNCRNLY